MQQSNENEQQGAVIDEEVIAALLADLPTLLTEDEQTQLRECADLAAKQNLKMAEIGLVAARRHATTVADEVNRREAIGRFYLMLTFQQMQKEASENLIEN
jgi:hypothetical protein